MTDNNTEQKEFSPVAAFAVVEVTLGFKEAYVTIVSPKNGGADISAFTVENALREKGVVYGIDNDIIREKVEKRAYDKQFVAAKWLAPVNGVDGTITYLFDTKTDLKPKEDDDGFVDYKDLGSIRNVTKDTVIAEITLPTLGEPGVDLRNIRVQQIVGRKAQFGLGDNTLLTEDGTKIVAACDGHLRYAKDKFCIDKTVVINGDVDNSVGHIEFIGDVIVKGEICEGFKVLAQKNVTVYGNVNGGNVVAGGNVTIKKGSINSSIKAHGDIKMTFCENSRIECDGNLTSSAYIFSNIHCSGEMSASGNPGAIIGGEIICLSNINAVTIGSDKYTKTTIILGDNAIMFEEKNRTLLEIKRIEEDILKCAQIMDFLTEKKKLLKTLPPDKEELFSNAFKTKIVRLKDKAGLERKISEIDEHLRERQELGVSCRREMFPGVTVTINDMIYNVNGVIKNSRLSLGEDGFELNSLYK